MRVFATLNSVLHLLLKYVSKAQTMFKLPRNETKSVLDPELSNFWTEFRSCKNAKKKILDNIAQHLKSKKDVNRLYFKYVLRVKNIHS